MMTGGVICPLMDLCSACPSGTCYEPDPEDLDCDCTPGCDTDTNLCCTSTAPPKCSWRLIPANRTAGGAQICAIKQLTKPQQAAECTLDALGLNPFILADEL